MSIFDLYDDQYLPGDKSRRQLKNNVLEYEHFKQDAKGEEIFKVNIKPIWFGYLLSIIFLGILLGQLIHLQITQGAFNLTLAEGNRIRTREIASPRGLIYDTKSNLLAKNTATFDLEIYPLDLPKNQEEREDIFKKLANLIHLPLEEIAQKVEAKGYSTYDPIVLKENVDRETALILKTKTVNMPGIIVSKRPIREYVSIEGLGPIIGFVGKMTEKDLKENPGYKPFHEIGKEGIELNYEKFLKGIPGILEVEVDSRGRQQRQLSTTSPSPGDNLFLNIDSDLEVKMFKAIRQAVTSLNKPGGAGVALNPQTGQVLAMVSYPSFDNNLFVKSNIKEEYQYLINDPRKPLFHRAISGTYPSGSTIKPFVAAAGLQEEIITSVTTIKDPGEIRVGNWVYPDWKAHGFVDVRKALAESCNVFFYSVAGGWDKIKGLGIAKLEDYLLDFGFGAKTGIDLPSEVIGLVPDPEWKEKNKKEIWYLGDTYHLGIGQGDFLVTPLQMAITYSAIANGGEVLKPQVVKKITDKDEKVIYEFKKGIIRKDFIKAEHLQVVREGLRQAVTYGSAKMLNNLPEAVAAKTGTAQFGNEGQTHAWIAAFAPYSNPEIVLVIIVEEGGEGYATAGPIAYEILDWYFSRQ